MIFLRNSALQIGEWADVGGIHPAVDRAAADLDAREFDGVDAIRDLADNCKTFGSGSAEIAFRGVELHIAGETDEIADVLLIERKHKITAFPKD